LKVDARRRAQTEKSTKKAKGAMIFWDPGAVERIEFMNMKEGTGPGRLRNIKIIRSCVIVKGLSGD
jgi:hypothetical protein